MLADLYGNYWGGGGGAGTPDFQNLGLDQNFQEWLNSWLKNFHVCVED